MNPLRRRPAPAPDRARQHHELERIERARRLMTAAVEHAEEGIVVLDTSLTPLLANPAARAILNLGAALPALLPRAELNSLARNVLSGPRGTATVELGPDARGRVVRARAVLDRHAGGEGSPVGTAAEPLVLLYLRDVTDEVRVQAQRRQFVAHASHELKTPTASIRALAEAIADAAGSDASAAAAFATRLVGETARLDALVRDLLDLSRLEDPSSIARDEVELSTLAEREARAAADAAAAAGLSFTARIADGVKVRGDASQLSLMLRNLLDNAVRYTDPGGEVALHVDTAADQVSIAVRDTGRGIPMRDQARVFERFYRVDQGRARSEGGTGLGLAIVKHVVELHGGSVAVQSQLGEGSTFTVHLRRAPDPPGPPAAPPVPR